MSSTSRFTIFVLVIVALAALAGGYLWLLGSQSQPQPTPTPTITESITPTPTETPLPETAAVLVEDGKVQLTHENKDTLVEEQSDVYVGDKIHTFANSKATLIFPDNDVMRLDDNTEITILALVSSDTDSKVKIELNSGNTWSRVESLLDRKKEYSVETSTLVATVRGTVFNVDATDENESWVGVTESQVDVQRKEDQGVLPVTSGNFASVKKAVKGKLDKMLAQKLDDQRLNSDWFKNNKTKDQKIKDFLTKANKKKLEKNFLRNNWKMFFEKIAKTPLNGTGALLPTTGIFDPRVALRDILAELVVDKEITPDEANGVMSDAFVQQQIMTMTTNSQIAAFVTDYFEQIRSMAPIGTVSPSPIITPEPTPTSSPSYNPQYYYYTPPLSPTPIK